MFEYSWGKIVAANHSIKSSETFWRTSDVFRLVNYTILSSSRTVDKILTSRWRKHIWQTS